MREERISVAGLELMLQRPDDAEDLIDESRFEQDEFLPYWAELWPSGIALARHVATLELAGKRVLELGCGLALPSFAAAAAGADVLATDWAPEALVLVALNAAANGLHVRTALVDWHAASPPGVAPADVGSAADVETRNAARGLVLPRYDLVLAADVLYEERNAVPLLAVLAATTSEAGTVILADPGRRHAPAFFERAAGDGWSVERLPAPGLPSGSLAILRRATSPEDDGHLC